MTHNTFILHDIPGLKKAYRNSSISNDCLLRFLSSFSFESVFETEDDSIVFAAGGKNNIDIEFFNFYHPLKRSGSVMYWENGEPCIIKL